LQSNALVGRVAELGSLGESCSGDNQHDGSSINNGDGVSSGDSAPHEVRVVVFEILFAELLHERITQLPHDPAPDVGIDEHPVGCGVT